MGEEQHGHPSTSAWVLVKSKGYGQAAFGATSFARRACRVMGRDRCVAGGHVRISGEDHYRLEEVPCGANSGRLIGAC